MYREIVKGMDEQRKCGIVREVKKEGRSTGRLGIQHTRSKGIGYIELYVRLDTKERREIASVGRVIKPLIKPQKDPWGSRGKLQ